MTTVLWTVVLATCALCCAVACWMVWQRAFRGAARSFCAGMAGGALWCAAVAVLSTGPGEPVVVVARLVTTAGALTVAASAYWMARTATDPHHRPTLLDRLVLVLPPAVVVPSLATNPWHQLLYVDDAAGPGTAHRWWDGPLYPALIALLGVPAVHSLVHLVRGLRRSPAHFRPHVRSMLVFGLITSAAVVASLVISKHHQHVDLVPLGLAAAALAGVRALVGRQLLAVVPLARAQVVEELPDAVLVTDRQGVVVDLNASCRALLERLGAEGPDVEHGVAGKPLRDLLPFLGPLVAGAGADEASPSPGLHLDVRTSTIRSRRGAVVGTAVLLRDVSEVVERRLAAERDAARLAEEAARDPLTGLLNRRGLHAAAAALPVGAALSVAILDVDHFKAVNDVHGHEAGDSVLRSLAAVLVDVLVTRLPAGSAVGRLGGEEFAVLVPGLAEQEAARAVEGILLDVRRTSTPASTEAGPVQLRVTASAGVAAGAGPRATLSELLGRADAALYAAKRAGRDRLVVAAPGPAPVS